ncbi:hypothetical protein EUGRSUZ_G00831 [Eucalyptus grandis]|uniref:Uncharacterized protein n=2 Tax=Eucalyptus grandis TaxID=71139 RepID=A0ACC3K1X0_EUCGR|nr:hypothetical protein EUGRSUZ_G00831 [Eucalyptus grandis]
MGAYPEVGEDSPFCESDFLGKHLVLCFVVLATLATTIVLEKKKKNYRDAVKQIKLKKLKAKLSPNSLPNFIAL